MSRFPRYLRLQLEVEDREKLAAIFRDAEAQSEEDSVAAGATAGGDGSRLRGSPAISRGTAGAIPGTDPVRALLAKEAGDGGRGASPGSVLGLR